MTKQNKKVTLSQWTDYVNDRIHKFDDLGIDITGIDIEEWFDNNYEQSNSIKSNFNHFFAAHKEYEGIYDEEQ